MSQVPWTQLPEGALATLDQLLGRGRVGTLRGLQLLEGTQAEELDIDWSVTPDPLFVGDAFKWGVHIVTHAATLGGSPISLRRVPVRCNIGHLYRFTDGDGSVRGTVHQVTLIVLPGTIQGRAHGGFVATKTITVYSASESKALRPKPVSQDIVAEREAEQSLFSFVLLATQEECAPEAMPMTLFYDAFEKAVWFLRDKALTTMNPKYYFGEALFSDACDLDCKEGRALQLLRKRMLLQCEQIANMANAMGFFLDLEHDAVLELEAEHGTKAKPKQALKDLKICNRATFLAVLDQMRHWLVDLPGQVSQLEALFRACRIRSEVSEHSVGELFKKGVEEIVQGAKVVHLEKEFELEEDRSAGLATLEALDRLVERMGIAANKLMSMHGDGLDIKEHGMVVVQELERIRTEILLVITGSGSLKLKLQLLDPNGLFYQRFNRLSAQNCADKREDIWGKFLGWWANMSETTRKRRK